MSLYPSSSLSLSLAQGLNNFLSMSGFVFMFVTQLYESLTAVYVCARACVGEGDSCIVTREKMHVEHSLREMCVFMCMHVSVQYMCVLFVCWSDCRCFCLYSV